MRERLYTIVHKAEPGDRFGKLYDIFIVAVAFASITPLMFKQSYPWLEAVDLVTVYILFADYIFRWITHDYKSRLRRPWSFVVYPVTPYALVIMLSLLPSLGLVGQGMRILRLLRIFVLLNYSDNIRYVARVFQKERRTLLSVLYIALFYIFVSALVMFVYEPETFETFFEAAYWATTALTTVGYGDVSPVTEVGRLISMVSSLFGIAVIALPAGIVTAGFVEEINKNTIAKEEAARKKAEEALLAKRGERRFALTDNIKRYAVVMAAGVLMNELLNLLADHLPLPLWLDMTGTAFAALMLEPAAGLLVGLANNMYLAATGGFGTGSLLFYAVSAATAVIVGVCMRKQGKLRASRILPTILLVILATTLLSASLDLVINRAAAPDSHWENLFYQSLSGAGLAHLPAFYLAYLAVRTADTLATAVLVGLFYLVSPKKLRRA